MLWLISKIKYKLIKNQKYKYAGYLRNLEIKLKRKSNYLGFPNTLNK